KDLPPMEMMMYGTLQDFEQSLEAAASRHQDKQVTIEQLVQDYAPDPAGPGQPEGSSGAAPDTASVNSMPDDEVLQISEALFGDQPGL
ncbi:MAG TPA: hypothetical protein DD640_04685, partial [Clostridiales bacterium]|nr:hypothetical protein [Clostridiales bacterium]